MKGVDRRGKDVAIPPEKSRLESGDAQHAVKDDLHEGPTVCDARATGDWRCNRKGPAIRLVQRL